MKKLYFLLLLLTGIVNAQIVNIPDANFKTALVSTICVDTNGDGSSDTNADINNDGEIELSEALAVIHLKVSTQNISSLAGIENFTNLQSLDCSSNQLITLDISTLTQLKTLICPQNNLTALDVTNQPLLIWLWCQNNQLTSIDLSNNPHLLIHNLSYNLFTTLDFSANVADPANGDGATFVLSGNPNLTYVNFKNGITQNYAISLDNCPNLAFVCAEGSHIAYIQSSAFIENPAAIVFNSYCSFTPGGEFNSVTGKLSFDADNNGCDGNDPGMSQVRVKIDDGVNTGINFSNPAGNYTFYTGVGNYTIEPQLEIPNYFNVSPASAAVNFPIVDESVQTQNFCISANGNHPDLEIILTPSGPARPGFDANYLLVYKNKGNQAISGSVSLNFDDALTDFVSSAPNADSQSVNNLSWNFSNLLPFQTQSIHFTLNVNSTVENPPVNIGDILNSTASINYATGDETPDDNVFELHQHVVNALDPNDKTCLEGENITFENVGKYLHYNINFENTGTSDAVNVVVKDIIDTTKFEINSLQLLYSSYPAYTRINGNVVEFIFENINLPPSSVNPIGGHGNVLFKIKTLPGLAVGTEVSNTAGIYFDYNAPIATNTARTTFAALSKTDFTKDNSIVIYPNPVKNSVHIMAKSIITNVQLFDIEGRILQTIFENKNDTALDISKQLNGIYFLKIITADGSTTEKIIKE